MHAVALAGGAPLTRDHFPRPLVGTGDRAHDVEPARARSRDAIPRAAIADAMRACNGNVTEAARRLGVARTTV